jgi:hypothetical protein
LAEGHPGRLARGATAVGMRAGPRWRRPSGRDVEGFFEGRSRGSGRPRPQVWRPAWLGPPEDSFGVLVPLRLVVVVVVVRTADLAVAIPGATAYRTGFGFDLAIRGAAAEDDPFTLDRTLHWLGREGSPPPEVLRVGVQFTDGQRATGLDTWWDYFDPQSWTQTPPSGPVLLPHGGGGGQTDLGARRRPLPRRRIPAARGRQRSGGGMIRLLLADDEDLLRAPWPRCWSWRRT